MSNYYIYDFVSKKYTSMLNGLDHAIALAAKAQRDHFGKVIVEIDERKKPLVVFDNRLQSRGGRVINCLRFESKKTELIPEEKRYIDAIFNHELPAHEEIRASINF